MVDDWSTVTLLYLEGLQRSCPAPGKLSPLMQDGVRPWHCRHSTPISFEHIQTVRRDMAGIKRSHDGKPNNETSVISPFMPMFEIFRNELDEHHDRRERIIKASRDITALSKKM